MALFFEHFNQFENNDRALSRTKIRTSGKITWRIISWNCRFKHLFYIEFARGTTTFFILLLVMPIV